MTEYVPYPRQDDMDHESHNLEAQRLLNQRSEDDNDGVQHHSSPQDAPGASDSPYPPGAIIVRTSQSRSKKHHAPPDNDDCCDCTPLCHKVGIDRCIPKGTWCVRDICGIVCAIFTWLLILYAEYVVLFVMLLPVPSDLFRWLNGIVFHFLAVMAFSSHIKTMFSDPGTVPIGNATKENILRMGFREGQIVYKCPKCCSIKPNRTHHCSVCHRCIKKMDHHCPWVNNCVGEYNQKFFVLFTFYICLMSFFSIYMCIHYFVICIGSEWEDCRTWFSPPVSTVLCALLGFEGLLFGSFTMVMCCSQMCGIASDTTGIESLKKDRPNQWEKKSKWLSLESVFGHPFNWRWFSPFVNPHFLQGKQDVLLYTV